MKLTLYKYRRNFSYLFLSAYLFFLALTILHYHHINIQNGNFKVERHLDDQIQSHPDKLLEIYGECLVLHFSSTIDNISYIPYINIKKLDNKTYLHFKYPNKIPKQEIGWENHLRAPPPKFS